MPQPTATTCLVDSRRAAAPAPVAGGGATRAALLRRLSDALDELQRLESLEARTTRCHDRKIVLAEEIDAKAQELRATYRGPATRAPLWQSADGLKAGW